MCFKVMRVGFDSLQSIIWQTVKRSFSRKVEGITLLHLTTVYSSLVKRLKRVISKKT